MYITHWSPCLDTFTVHIIWSELCSHRPISYRPSTQSEETHGMQTSFPTARSDDTNFFLIWWLRTDFPRYTTSHFNCCRFLRPHFHFHMCAHPFHFNPLNYKNRVKILSTSLLNRSTERNKLNVRKTNWTAKRKERRKKKNIEKSIDA